MKTIIDKTLASSRFFKLSFVLLLFLTPALLDSAELSKSQVRSAVQTWVRYVPADADPNAVVSQMQAHTVDGKIVAYIAHLDDGGFCICGQDDLLLPVYLYSPKGSYDSNNPNYKYILWEMDTRTKLLTDMLQENKSAPQLNQQALIERASLWQDLIAGNIPARVTEHKELGIEPVSMVLKLTSIWHQFHPYNDQCPVPPTLPGEHCIVGCVATAMAQIMNYWEWPDTGTDSNTVVYNSRARDDWDGEPCPSDPMIPLDWGGGSRLQWTLMDGGTLWMRGTWDWSVLAGAQNDSAILNKTPQYLAALEELYNRLTPAATNCFADFAATTYNWNLLEDVHKDPPDAGDTEVAKLCKHVGVSINTTFGLWGSSSSGPEIENAVKTYFRYDPDAVTNPTNIYTMTDEITWLRPVAIGGQAVEGGGHMWVVLGYDKATDPDRLFLMNMGWRNGEVEWYTWDHYFPVGQEHVTRIAPINMVKFVGNTIPGDGSPSDPYEDMDEAILEAPDWATLIFKAGSVHTLGSYPYIIFKPLTLKGYNAVIQ